MRPRSCQILDEDRPGNDVHRDVVDCQDDSTLTQRRGHQDRLDQIARGRIESFECAGMGLYECGFQVVLGSDLDHGRRCIEFPTRDE